MVYILGGASVAQSVNAMTQESISNVVPERSSLGHAGSSPAIGGKVGRFEVQHELDLNSQWTQQKAPGSLRCT